jgi:hypothetical protein
MVEPACTAFVQWLLAQNPIPGSFHLRSLPGLPWSESDYDPWDWYEKLMAEVAKWDPPPVLVDLDDYLVTHRGEVLWPPPERQRIRRPDKRSRPSDAPFPIGWFGQDLDEYRIGPNTYNCYSPDELPPIGVPFTGNFDWLEAAPEYERSIGANLQSTAAALQQLLESGSNGLPSEFVRFFRTPSLWRRIRSCTDCYLHLDKAAVGIRGGFGSLVRFLSDSQDCKHWHLHISPCGKRPSVVATYF